MGSQDVRMAVQKEGETGDSNESGSLDMGGLNMSDNNPPV